ncbi:MAG: PRC-barrel domain-containing protein [Rhodospirillaceae bacterium]|nr:PRC-barrel domain-containing protein [Rhodospirillaceae bacterium]
MTFNRTKQTLLAATAGATLLTTGAFAQNALDGSIGTGAAAGAGIQAVSDPIVVSEATLQTGITVDVTSEEGEEPRVDEPGIDATETDADMEHGTYGTTAPSYYIDADVYAGDNARLGTITDVVRDPTTGEVYFVIYQEEADGMPSRTMPVPVNRFALDDEDHLTLPDYTPDSYATYLGLDVTMYEQVEADSGAEIGLDETEADASMEHGTSETDLPSYHIDVDVFAADAPVGHIDDVVRDPATGEVYLVVSQEATADMPSRQVAVPADHFSLDAQDHVMWPAYSAEDYQALPDYDATMYERVTVD